MKAVCKAWKKCAEDKIAIREKHYRAQVLTFAKTNRRDNFVSFNRLGGIASWRKDSENFCKLQNWRNGWSAIPRSGICMSFWHKSSRHSYTNAEDMMRYWLPDDAKLLVLPCLEYTICVDNRTTSYEMIDDLNFIQNFISFPPNNSRHSVEFLHLAESDKDESLQQFKGDIAKEVNDPNTKLLFVCVDINSPSLMRDLPEYMTSAVFEKDVAVVGCLFDKPIIYNPQPSNTKTGGQYKSKAVVLSFKGEAVRATSLVIGDSVKSTDAYMQKLKQLQSTVADFCKNCNDNCANRNAQGFCDSCSAQTIAIMVACVGRCDSRDYYFDEQIEVMRNFETSMFRSMIPNVPIIGTYGVGEIGIDREVDVFDYPIKSESTIFGVVRFQ